MFNQFNLGCDIMEPLRTVIDRKVKVYMPEKFEKEEKKFVLQTLSDEFIIDGKRQNLLNVFRIYVKSVLSAVENNDYSEIKFFRYEL